MKPIGYILAGLMLIDSFSWAKGRKPSFPSTIPHFSSWAVYWDDVRSKEAAQRLANQVEEISVFAYHFKADGHLTPATPSALSLKEALIQSMVKPRPRLLLTIVNDKVDHKTTQLKNSSIVHQVLETAEARAKHIRELLDVCKSMDGISIDYERLDPADRELFTVFIQKLGEALHRRHQWLSVIVQPRMAETQLKDRNGAGVIDWAGIAPFVDEIKIMAYMLHYGTSAPGSIAPISWINELALYAKKTIPLKKLCIILHTGGFDWPDDKPGRPIEFPQAHTLAASKHQKIVLDEETDSGHFEYQGPTGRHEVWIEDGEGLRQKVIALSQQGIQHIGFWRLGTGDQRLWEMIADVHTKNSF